MRGLLAVVVMASFISVGTGSASAAAEESSYVVVLRPGLQAAQPVRADRVFSSAIKGFEARLTPTAAARLARDPAVALVEPNRVHQLDAGVLGVQPNPPSWGLDRIDQRNLPLDNSYTFPNLASNLHAYILSTGVRVTHTDFGGRAIHGRDTIDNDNDASDCQGSGTHLAGIVGGTSHGVAKGVTIVAMRIVNCAGSATTAQVIAGIDWVTANAIKPAVAVLAVGGPASAAMDAAIKNSIASGVSYSVVAGGSASDACSFSPGRVTEALTVGASSITDAVSASSSSGPCLDLYAPGVGIKSTWHTSDTAVATISGTTPASAHVAGAAALIASAHPLWTALQIHNKVVADATPGVLTGVPPNTANLLLYVDNGGPPPACGGANGTDVSIPDYPGAAVTSAVTVTCAGTASPTAAVKVNIVHTWIGDLIVELIAPDGSTYLLHNRTGGSADNINQSYPVDLSSETRAGVWRLRAQDFARADTGFIDSWTVTL